MIQEHVLGRIQDIKEDGTAVITAALPSIIRAADRKYSDVEIILPDGRRITPKQRRLVYSILGCIAEFVDGIRNAETVESAKLMTKWDFILTRMEGQERRLFSLSNCDETTAKEYINYLLEFVITNDIPLSFSPLNECEDIGRYVYACLMNKKCCICGRKADLHHVQAVGAGQDRREINHIGMECLPLCREHHSESHNIGQKDFMAKYHLEPVRIDEKIAKVYRLKTKERKA